MDTAGNFASSTDNIPDLSTRWQSQWIGAVGFLLLLTFTWLPNSYDFMVGWPYILIWQGAFFAIGIYTLRLCRQFSIPFGRLGYGFDSVAALTLIVGAASTINAQFRAVACWNFLLIVNYIICLYFLVNWLRYGKLSRQFLWMTLAIVGSITSVISLAMWRPNTSMWLSASFDSAIRNPQPLGHHNFVGGYELLVLPIILSFALSQTSWRRWLFATAASIALIALYVSGSRGALLGALTLSLLAICLGFILSKDRNRRHWVIASGCLLIAVSLALASNPRIRTLVSFTPDVTENNISVVSLSDGPTKDRIFMLEAARNILAEHPILGIGPGNLSRLYNTYRPIETGGGLTLVQQLHNTPAQTAVELGILGLVVYIAVLTALLRLGISLHHNIVERKDRILLYGIGASWFGYGVSSLSDYQLENIGIAIVLIATVALLISLGDDHKSEEKAWKLSNRARRIISLCLLVLLCSNFQLWARADAGLYLAHSGLRDGRDFDLVAADEKFAKASKLVPWDPTYSALGSETILNAMADIDSQDKVRELESLAIDYLKDSVKAAPNDPWFNQNLAVLLLNRDAEEAEEYAEQAARLSPRSYHGYTYYTLGLTYLRQEKIEEAIDSFVLEGLVNPIFLTANIWEEEAFLAVRDRVISKFLDSSQKILSETNKETSQYRWLHEQQTIISWWYGHPISNRDREQTRPLVHAILIADAEPEKALSLINTYIEQTNYSPDLHLIQARLSPEQYLESLLSELDGTSEERQNLEDSVKIKAPTKAWFSAVLDTPQSAVRYGASFAYRNLTANSIRKILRPGNIRVGVLPASLNFFADAPREYPQLDQYLATVRLEHLEIR